MVDQSQRPDLSVGNADPEPVTASAPANESVLAVKVEEAETAETALGEAHPGDGAAKLVGGAIRVVAARGPGSRPARRVPRVEAGSTESASAASRAVAAGAAAAAARLVEVLGVAIGHALLVLLLEGILGHNRVDHGGKKDQVKALHLQRDSKTNLTNFRRVSPIFIAISYLPKK